MRVFSANILYFILLLTLGPNESLADVPGNRLDNLRTSIHAMQDSLQYFQNIRDQYLQEFKHINEQIYRLKNESVNRSQPLLQIRLQNALKSSREIADRISGTDLNIRKTKTLLQKLYQEMIYAIDIEIGKRLEQSVLPNRSNLEVIQKLGEEKLTYLNGLQSIKISEEEWQNLEIDPDDTPQRIEMKTAILSDKLKRLERSIELEEHKLGELIKDHKVQQEMLSFYYDLSRSVEDEQEIFDRNRLDEVKELLENLSVIISEMENSILAMKVSEMNLHAKIERFKKNQY